MTDKQLKDKAIDIKGKDYVLVKDRINYFNENYQSGMIPLGCDICRAPAHFRVA